MKNPFEKKEITILISLHELHTLLQVIRSIVPANVDEGEIVDIHDTLNHEYEKMKNAP